MTTHALSYTITLSTIQGLICIVSDVDVPELVSAFWISRVRISGVRASAFPIGGRLSYSSSEVDKIYFIRGERCGGGGGGGEDPAKTVQILSPDAAKKNFLGWQVSTEEHT